MPAAEGRSIGMDLIVFTGDSHTDGCGAPAGQSWPAQMMRLLGRPESEMAILARAGAPLGGQVAAWDATVRPLLEGATGRTIVFGMGGYNDVQQTGATADAIVDVYRRQGGLARAAGALYVAGLDVIRFDGDGAMNAVIRAVNDVLRREGASFSDAMVDFAAEPDFDRPLGPYPQPPFADDKVHLDQEGQRRMAAMAAPVFARLLAGG